MTAARIGHRLWPSLSVLTAVLGVIGLFLIAQIIIENSRIEHSLADVIPAGLLYLYVTPSFLFVLVGSLIAMRIGRNQPIGELSFYIGVAQAAVCALGVLEGAWCLLKYPKTDVLLPASLIAVGAVGAWVTLSQIAALPRNRAKQTLTTG